MDVVQLHLQHAILERLAYKAHQRVTEKAGQQFFRIFRKYTVMGFYTTRVSVSNRSTTRA
jgi:hypothetical protein